MNRPQPDPIDYGFYADELGDALDIEVVGPWLTGLLVVLAVVLWGLAGLGAVAFVAILAGGGICS